MNQEQHRGRQEVLAAVAKLDLPLIDLHEDFSKQSDPQSLFIFRMPNHYSAAGYTLVARSIESRLRRQGMGDSSGVSGRSEK